MHRGNSISADPTIFTLWATFVLKATLIVGFFVSYFSLAVAQRGEGYVQQEKTVSTILDGFPGMFDTHMAIPGEFVADFPSFSLDYGINDNLSLGLNTAAIYPLSKGVPALFTKLRYRFFSNKLISSVITSYQGVLLTKNSNSNSTTTLGYHIISNNTSIHFENGILNFFGMSLLGIGNTGQLGQIGYSNSTAQAIVYGATGQVFFNDWIAGQVLVAATTKVSAEMESVSASGGIDANTHNYYFVRTLADFKLGKIFLLSPGFLNFVTFSPDFALIPVPIIGASLKW